ncbi:MAG: hypothetical protein P4L31_04485, partial [Candidatus Babeliales bacterium]|nr:hypothetical protein [Candidatus Babeliales bacterium]
MQKIVCFIGLIICGQTYVANASSEKTEPVYKKGELVRVNSNSDKGAGKVLGIYHELNNGQTVFEENNIEFVKYVQNVIPEEQSKKLYSRIQSEEEQKEVDEYVMNCLRTSKLDDARKIYVVE